MKLEINTKSQKYLLWTFVVMATIFSLAYWKLLKFFPPVPANLSHEAIVELYAKDNMVFRVGCAIMMLCGGFYFPLSVVISAQMARIEKGYPIWSQMQLMAAVLGTWLNAFPPFMWGVTAFSIDRDPALTAVLHEMAWLVFVTPPSYFAMQLFPIAIVSISKFNTDPNTAFPRWFGYLTFWMAVTGLFGVAGMLFKTGPFAWNGWFTFYLPLTAFGLWLGAAVKLMLRGIRLQAAEQVHN